MDFSFQRQIYVFKQLLCMEQTWLSFDFLNMLSLLTFGLHGILTLPNETLIIARRVWKNRHVISFLLIKYCMSKNKVPNLF